MSPRRLAAAVLAAAGLAVPGHAASVRPVALPEPEFVVTVAPLSLGVTRPAFEPPASPPVAAPPVGLGGAPLPRFHTALAKPLPAVADPGAFSCAFLAFRRGAALVDCGTHRLLQGDVRGARTALEESVATEPRGAQAPAAFTWLGEVALTEARFDPRMYEQAERRYRSALALGPPGELAVHAALGLGWATLRRGDLPEAQRALAQALDHVPSQGVALLTRFLEGVTQLLAGRPAEALALWDGVAASGAPAGLREEILFWRGVALARLGDPVRAIQGLDGFVAAVPGTHPLRADAVVQAGWVALERGAVDQAVRRFLEAESAGPRAELRPQLRAGLVRAYLVLGDTGRATDVARRLAIEAPGDPLVAPALLLLADDAVRRGAPAEALEVYRQLVALPLAPPMADYAAYRLADALEQEGRVSEAKGYFRRLRDQGADESLAQRATYRLGLLALRDRDPAAARREGEGLLRAGAVPELREAALLLTAEAAGRSGDPNRAATLLRLALREAPRGPRAGQLRLALGWAVHDDGDPESALREWEDLAKTADVEWRTPALLAIAEVSRRQGHEEQALVALRQLPASEPGSPLAELIALDRGILAVAARAYQEAVQTLEPLGPRVVDLPRQALLRRALGIARYRLGQLDLAEREFRRATVVAPAEPSSWLGAGLAALLQSRFVEADEALGRARVGAVAEVAAPASYGLALVAWRRRDADSFRERATAFVQRHPAHPGVSPVLYALVTLALEGGDLDRADAWIKRLVRDQPQSEYAADALVGLATAAQGRPALARQAYRDLLARRPPGELRAEAQLGVAEAALALGDGADAARALGDFLREAPGDPRAPRAQAMLVRAHQTQGRPDQAIRAAEAFLVRFPADPAASSILLIRGQLLLEARRLEEAQRTFETARDRGDPTVAAPAQFYLGEVLQAKNEHEAAIAAYLAATYLYPDTPWAAQGLRGAAQSYVSRRMPREAGILLRKLAATPGVDPALAQWARQALAQLGAAAAADPAAAARKGSPPRP